MNAREIGVLRGLQSATKAVLEEPRSSESTNDLRATEGLHECRVDASHGLPAGPFSGQYPQLEPAREPQQGRHGQSAEQRQRGTEHEHRHRDRDQSHEVGDKARDA